MPAKEGCSVSTTSGDTSASPRAPWSTSARRASRCNCRSPSLLSRRASPRSRPCSLATRGSPSPPGRSAARPASPPMSRTSAEVRSAQQTPSPSLSLYSAVGSYLSSLSLRLCNNNRETAPHISANDVDKLLRSEIGLCQQEPRCDRKLWATSAKQMAPSNGLLLNISQNIKDTIFGPSETDYTLKMWLQIGIPLYWLTAVYCRQKGMLILRGVAHGQMLRRCQEKCVRMCL